MGSFQKNNFINKKHHNNNNRSISKLAEFGHTFLYGCYQHIYCDIDIINFIIFYVFLSRVMCVQEGGGEKNKNSAAYFYAHSVPFKKQCICTNYTAHFLC